jgi:hypothetical protein
MTAALLTVFLLSFQVAGERKSPTTDEILSLVLQHSFKDGGFTVVDPDTEVRHLERIAKHMGVIEEMLDLKYYGLVEKLFEKNKKSSRLSLKSDPSKGYVIDYDGKFRRYFEKDGGGWEQWYKENPNAHGMTSVSLPVIDEKSGVVLVYKGGQSNWLAGGGFLTMYKYKDGKLEFIKSYMIWIS